MQKSPATKGGAKMGDEILILKSSPEDFIVKEITRSYKILEPEMQYSRDDLKYP